MEATPSPRRNKKIGLLFASLYLLVVGATIMYAFWYFLYQPLNSEFAGIFYVIATLPWSIILVPIGLGVDFALGPSVYNSGLTVTVINFLVLSLGAFVNAYLLYRMGRRF